MYGIHCVETWSATQGAVALSSAEAEYYALVEGETRAKGIQSIAEEVGEALGLLDFGPLPFFPLLPLFFFFIILPIPILRFLFRLVLSRGWARDILNSMSSRIWTNRIFILISESCVANT